MRTANIILPIVVWLSYLAGAVERAKPAHELPIDLKVTPMICLAPCDVRLDVRIASHPDNRWWVLEVDGPIFRGSKYQLDGMGAPIQQRSIEMKGLPEGEYEVKAILYRIEGEVNRRRVILTVSGDK